MQFEVYCVRFWCFDARVGDPCVQVGFVDFGDVFVCADLDDDVVLG